MKFFIVFIVIVTSTAVLAGPMSIQVDGNKDATLGQYPYQISYQWGYQGSSKHFCSGAIISPTWVLTAGCCVIGQPEYGAFKIIAGINSLITDKGKGQEVFVAKKIVHPKYNGGATANDIALLKLSEPLIFNENIQSIALPISDGLEGSAVLTGWRNLVPNVLQTIEVELIEVNKCEDDLAQLTSDALDLDLNICSGPLDGGYSACSGDSGGPLVQNGTIIGVVSWEVVPCGTVGAPSVYSRVAAFIDFITDNVDDLS